MPLITFPTILDTWTAKVDKALGVEGDDVLADHVNKLQEAVEALETKVGIDDSEVATAIDYLLRNKWETVFIPAASMIPAGTNPAATGTKEYATNDVNRDYCAFDGGATEEHVNFPFVFPENWNRGAIRVKFIWSSATGSTAGDTVEWAMRGKFCRNDDAIDAVFGTPQVISDTLLANAGADQQITAKTPEITLGGTGAAGCMVDFDIYRNTDGSDTMTEDAWLFGIVIQLKTTSINSEWS